MRLFLALILAATCAGCSAMTTSTAYVPQGVAAPAACAPAPAAVPMRVVYVPAAPVVAPAAPAAAPCAPAPAAPAVAPAEGPCANGSCAVPQAWTPAAPGGYMVTETRYTLNNQAASAAMIPADLIGCGASFLRCVWTRIVDPILPPANASGGYQMSGR